MGVLLGQSNQTRESSEMTNSELEREILRLEGDVITLQHQLEEWKRVATRLAHAYRDNSIQESTRAFVEYARLKAQNEGKQ
jgi:hypothetical protein